MPAELVEAAVELVWQAAGPGLGVCGMIRHDLEYSGCT